MPSYAITSKKTRQPVSQQHYLDYLDSLSDLGTVYNLVFETTRGLHCHYVLKTNDDLDYRKLYKTKYGWNHKSVKLYNPKGWTKYCRKDYHENKELNEHEFPEDGFEDDPPIIMKRIIPKLNK